MIVARWETRRKKRYYELYKNPNGYSYRCENGGGNLGEVTEVAAIAMLEDKLSTAKEIDNITYTKVG